MGVAPSVGMWRRWAIGSVLASAALFGCSSADKFLYSPSEQATATVDGFPASRYGIPPERPLGTVLVASPGVVDMKFEGGVKTRMLSARMIVMNNQDDVPWKIDTREVRAAIAGVGETAPAYVNADRQELPVIEVRPGQKQTIECFFPLPPSTQGAKHLPEFDLVWQVPYERTRRGGANAFREARARSGRPRPLLLRLGIRSVLVSRSDHAMARVVGRLARLLELHAPRPRRARASLPAPETMSRSFPFENSA